MLITYKKLILWFCLIIILLLMTYSNHFNNTFHFDDAGTIVFNPFIQNLHNIPLFFTDAATVTALPTNQTYRPMLTTSLAFDYWMSGGLDPLWFHVSTFFWYAVQCILMYFFFLKITNTSISSRWNAYFCLFSITWYGLHTANAETINYISARSDALSTCWLILAFTLFIYLPTYRKWGLYLIPFIIATLFKETAFVFPALLFLYVLYFEENASPTPSPRVPRGISPNVALCQSKEIPRGTQDNGHGRTLLHALKTTLPSWITAIMMLVLCINMIPASSSPGGTSVYLYLITQPFVIAHYAQTFFLPLTLSADTDWTLLSGIDDWRFWMGSAFLIALLIIAFLTAKKVRTRPISFGILWFLIALLPTSSIIPLFEVLNDHRTFFPYIGLLLAVSYAFYLVIQRHIDLFNKKSWLKYVLMGSLCLLLGAHAYGTYQRNEVWKTEESLWHDVTIKSPLNSRGWMYYGVSQMNKGNYALAEKCFSTGLTYTPTYGVLSSMMGLLKDAQGKPDEALDYLKKGVEYRPLEPGPRLYYATYLNKIGQWREAENVFIEYIRLFPNDIGSRHSLMALYHEHHQVTELAEEAREALRFNPHDATAKGYLMNIK